MEVPATSRHRRQAKLTLGAGIGYRISDGDEEVHATKGRASILHPK